MNHIYAFLSSLYRHFEPGSVLYLWTLPDKKTYPFQAANLQEMATMASQLTVDRDVYFGVGATSHIPNEYKRLEANEVTALPGVWVDIDVFHPVAHKNRALPPDIGAAMGLLPDQIPHSLVVWSGYGLHAYWLFREPWELDTPEERERAKSLLSALQGSVKYAASQHGWKIDTTSDLCRVMRLPGTMNRKIPDSPIQAVVMERTDEIRYNPSDIEDLLPPVPVHVDRSRTTKFERRPTDGPADLMLRNCRFMQHCQLNAASIGYDEWLAMLTNVARAVDGHKACHHISAMDAERYNQKDTDEKIQEALNMNPQTCEYIRGTIGFPGCPSAGCGVQAPCGWSLSRTGQARATIRKIPSPTPESVLTPEVLSALATLKKEDELEYIRFKSTCKGKVNLIDLEKQVKQHSRQVESHLHVVQPGEKPGKRMLRDTVPELPVDLALPPNFRFEKSGILYAKENAAGDLTVQKAAGAPVVISERVVNVDTQTEKVEICFRYLNGWRRVLFPRSTAFSAKGVIQLADFGVPVSSETAKFLVKWFDALADANADRIPVSQSVSKMGWRGDREFILPTFSPKYRIDIDDDGSQQSISGFSVAGDATEWVSRMQYLRKSPKARFILAASFAAPLLRILGQRNFTLHNWGNSMDGKTATLWAAMSVWGNPDQLIGTFDSTPTALERKAALHSDLPLAVNEREVLSRNRKEDVNPLLYVLGEGRGKDRAKKIGLQSTATWRTIVMTTGEGTLSSAGSFDGVMTRVIEICDGPLAHDRDFARQLYHFLPRNHGHAGPVFLQHLLAADYGMVYSTYQEFQAAFRGQFPDRIDSHVDAVACVVTADYLAAAWVFGESWDQAKREAMATASHIMAGLITRTEASEAGRAWESFVDWIAENMDRFKDRSNGPRYGYVTDEGKIPFETGEIGLFVIRSIVDQFLTERFSSNRKILREWAASGYIESTQENGKLRYDFRGKTIDGGIRPRVIKIKSCPTIVGQMKLVGQEVGQW